MQRAFNGASAEHSTAAYFLSKGWLVSWPAVPVACKYDLIADDGHQLHRVQVKRATWNKNAGPNHYLQVRLTDKTCRAYQPGDFDLLAVERDGHLWLIPATEVIGRSTSLCLARRGKSVRSEETEWTRFKVR